MHTHSPVGSKHMDLAIPAHTQTRGEECVCLKEMRVVVETLKRTLVKRKNLFYILCIFLCLFLSFSL